MTGGTLAAMHAFIDSIPLAAIICNFDGVVSRWNTTSEELFGWKSTEIEGRALPGVPADEHAQLVELLRACQQGETNPGITVKRSAKDGSLSDYTLAYGPLTGADEQVAACILTFDRNSDFGFETGSVDSEAQLDQLMSSSEDAMWLVSSDSVSIRVNDRFTALLGRSSAELVGQAASAVVAPSSTATFLQLVQSALQHEESQMDIELIKADASTVWVCALSSAVTERDVLLTLVDVTERKQAEEAARLLQERWELVAGTNDGVWDWNVHTDEIEFSSNWHLVFGIPLDAIPQSLDEMMQTVHAEAREQVQASLRDLLDRKIDIMNEEVQMRCGGDTYRWMLVRAKALFDNDGACRVVGLASDISERKRIEENLRKSEQELLDAQELAGMGHWSQELETGHIWWSNMVYRIFGVPQERGPPSLEELTQIVHEEDRQLHANAVHRCTTTGEQYDIDIRIVVAGEPKPRHVNARGHVHRDDDGKIVRISGTVSDISDRKAVELQLRLLSSVAKQSMSGILLSDAEGRLLFVNPAFEQMSGYTADELHGKKPGDILQGPKTDPEAKRLLSDAVHNHKTVQVVLLNYHKSGREYYVEVNLAPVMDERGRCTHFVAIENDVTARKRAAEELEQARKEALESAKLKSEFLATMSHEIRTPMNGVIGMTGLLLDTPMTDEQRGYAQTVRASGQTLLTLINDILDFSKIEAGKLSFERVDFDLGTAVADVMDLMAESAQQKGLELVACLAPNVPLAVNADPGRLRQVLINLVGNAIKFTDRGQVVVKVCELDRTDQDHLVQFEVVDTGIGISEDSQTRLFKAFTQADGSMTRRFGGTGLGLAICRQLVELMNGNISVTSALGEGSTFRFTVRLAKSDFPPEEEPQPLPGPPLRVLCVDDNETALETLVEHVNRMGCRAIGTTNATDALEILLAAHSKGEGFQLLLCDRDMTPLDGLQLARGVSASPELQNSICIILLTPWLQRDLSTVLLEAGISGSVCKPVRPSQLRHQIARVFGLSTPGAAVFEVGNDSSMAEGLPPLRVLLAEDNSVNRKVAVLFIEKLGHRVDAVCDGREAVEAVGKVPYNVVLMDVQMPVMDGFKATELIRESEKGTGKRTPIIAVTANAMQGDRDKCIANGMDDYIPKPFEIEKLQQKLMRWGHQIITASNSTSNLMTPMSGTPRNSATQTPMHSPPGSPRGSTYPRALMPTTIPFTAYAARMAASAATTAPASQRITRPTSPHRPGSAPVSAGVRTPVRHTTNTSPPKPDAAPTDDDAAAPPVTSVPEELPPPLKMDMIEMFREMERDGPDKHIVADLARMFNQGLDDRLPLMESHLAANDLTELGKVTHMLKGAAGNVGAMVLRKRCMDLEAAIKEKELVGVKTCLGLLHEEAVRVRAALEIESKIDVSQPQ
eukprot:TRINITY_DN7689_c0_g1_i1.p1 TRINITY_DN7689_c0_g1~~TRINITY_DN7689_c0_g1_i1.p1  ORF type:complete len:1402 (-),score=360.07 TRINITY_DN7689_c0_g1_i1:63-4268(-)